MIRERSDRKSIKAQDSYSIASDSILSATYIVHSLHSLIPLIMFAQLPSLTSRPRPKKRRHHQSTSLLSSERTDRAFRDGFELYVKLATVHLTIS